MSSMTNGFHAILEHGADHTLSFANTGNSTTDAIEGMLEYPDTHPYRSRHEQAR